KRLGGLGWSKEASKQLRSTVHETEQQVIGRDRVTAAIGDRHSGVEKHHPRWVAEWLKVLQRILWHRDRSCSDCARKHSGRPIRPSSRQPDKRFNQHSDQLRSFKAIGRTKRCTDEHEMFQITRTWSLLRLAAKTTRLNCTPPGYWPPK